MAHKPKYVEGKDFNLQFNFKVKDAPTATEEGPEVLKIEGYASYAGDIELGDSCCFIDRTNDVVVPSGMSLENFRKNPILLLNHDRDYPIGKVEDIQKRPDGIYVVAEVYRDTMEDGDWFAIKHGIVCSFSIGFRTKEGSFRTVNDTEVYFMTKTELMELSCVTIPCNTNSTFQVVSKQFEDGSFYAGDLNLSPKDSSARSENKTVSEDYVKLKLRDILSEDKVKEIEDLGMGASLDELQEIDTKAFIEALVSKSVDVAVAKATEALKAELTKSADSTDTAEPPAPDLPTDEEVAAAEEEAKQAAEVARKAVEAEAFKALSDTVTNSLKALIEEK